MKYPASVKVAAAGILVLLGVRTVLAAEDDLAGLYLSTLMSMDVTLVTAQKRTEDVNTVPISMAVMKRRDARWQDLDSTFELQQAVPGLTTSVSQGVIVPYIRGIGTDNITSIEPSVSLYIDDVYLADRVQTFTDLADLEQFEVLKGPQGTLYGRNATGGAIKVITRGPTERLEGTARITAGNYRLRDVSVFVSGPVSDRARASFAGHVRERDALFSNTIGVAEPKSEDLHSLHGRLQIDLTPRLNAELLVKYLDRDDGLSSPTEFSASPVAALLGIPFSRDPQTSVSDVSNASNRVINTNTALKLNWNEPHFNVRSTTAYNKVAYRSTLDADGTAAPLISVHLDGPSHAFTHESQIASAPEHQRVDWLAGVFYIDNVLAYKPLAYTSSVPGGGFVTQDNLGKIHTKAAAGFGELALNFGPQFSLTTGLRYIQEKKILEQTENGIRGLPLNSYADQSHTWNNVSYRVVGKYLIAQSMLYAKTETAFKSGTFNNYDPANAGPTSPERITAYEFGVKHGFLSIPVRLTAAAFFNDYTNQQLLLLDATGASAFFTVAPRSRTQGLDGSIDVRAGQHWTVTAAVEVLDAKYRELVSDGILVVNPAGGHTVGSNLNASGNRMSRTPKYSTNLAIAFEYPVPGGSVFGATNYYRSGRVYFDPANVYVQSPFSVLNARAGYKASSGWQISAWAKNLNDTRYLNNLLLTPLGANSTYAEPRTYGLTMQYDFGP